MRLLRIFRLTGGRNNELQSAFCLPVCVKHICLFCMVLLAVTVTAFAAPILKQGSEGHDVLVLQQNLKKLGYPIEEDGFFGTTTYNAVVAFQRDEDLSPTGTVDRVTWHALQSRAAQKPEADAAESEQPPVAQDATADTDVTDIVNETASAQEPESGVAKPEQPSTAQNTTADTETADILNEEAPTPAYAPPEQEPKSVSRQNPRPATLPASQKTPKPMSKTPIPETVPPQSGTQVSTETAPPINQQPVRPAPKKEEPKAEQKETKPSPKMEKTPEQAPFLPKKKVDAVIKTAKKYIGTKYVFGGTTPKGFDCSGFVQYVFKQNGFSIPRTADEQYKLGKRIKKRTELEPGDLVFFTTYEKGASHCGIYLGKNQFIHVSSSKGVRTDSLDDSYWKPRWYGGKHIVK